CLIIELRQREHVAVWVPEPSHECATRRMPDPVIILNQAIVTLKRDSRRVQAIYCSAYVRNFPPQGRVWKRVDLINLLNAQHRTADSKNQRWRLVGHK